MVSSINNGLGQIFDKFYKTHIPFDSSEFLSIFILLFAVLLGDLCTYIQHRIQHKFGFLWDLHEFHHSATEMTMLSKNRGTPLETFLTDPLLIPFSVLSGLLVNEFMIQGYVIPFYMMSFYTALTSFNLFLGHSSLKVIYPKPFSYIFMSPALHWLHHSSNPKHYDCNFGQYFCFWDRIFNSYLDESNLNDIKGFGVPGTEYNKFHPLYSAILLPPIKLIKRFKSFSLQKT